MNIRQQIFWNLTVLPLVAGLTACKVTSINTSGPTPEVDAVTRSDDGLPTETAYCTELGGTMLITGKNFAPMPTQTLSDSPVLELPRVHLDAGSEMIELAHVTYDPDARTLSVTVPPGLGAGRFDLIVTNPGGASDTMQGAVLIVPPPQLTAVTPNQGLSGQITPVSIAGSAFRASDEGKLPLATLAPSAGGAEFGLAAVTLVSESELGAEVGPNLPVGTYQLTVTNPEGCSASLDLAFEVIDPPTIDLCGSVDPGFGWVNGRTRIEICANNAGTHSGLEPVPEVFLLVDNAGTVTQVPLIREALLFTSVAAGGFSDASVMSAVVPSSTEERGAGIVVGGPYDILVVNPDGAQAVIPGAFEVVADAPPHIDSISPEQGETGAAQPMTISGTHFKDPTASPQVARVVFLAAPLAAGDACASPDCFECTAYSFTSSNSVQCSPPLNSMSSGSWLVRYEHLDDGSFFDFAAFAVTNPAANLLQSTTDMPNLNQARFAHGTAWASDDLGNRFLYVAGGQSADATNTVMNSVEVSALSRFGDLGPWTILSPLPQAVSGLQLLAFDGYLFALGGASSDGTHLTDVWRARVLGEDTAPVMGAPTVQGGGTLPPGTYSYRVSAVMNATGTDNDGGESLGSDAESARLTEAGTIKIDWDSVDGAARYRIYRTPAANDLAGSEVLLAETTDTEFLDSSTGSPGTDKPLQAGTLGVWMAMASLPTARAHGGATIAGHDTTSFLYMLGGTTSGGSTAASDSYAYATLELSSGYPSITTFTEPSDVLVARSEQSVATLGRRQAPRLAGLFDSSGEEQFVVVAQGRDGNTIWQDVQIARVQSTGALGAFTEADNKANFARSGAATFAANNFIFTLGGMARSGNYLDKGITFEVCTANGTGCDTDPPDVGVAKGDSGIQLNTARYRPGVAYISGFFYFVGGQSAGDNSTMTVERGEYQ